MRSTAAPAFALIALASFAPPALAAPAAPVVTVGAELKLLQFDWDAVPTSSRYELWFKSNAGTPWVKYMDIAGGRTERVRINVSVHLLHWPAAKYRVAACNSAGCTNSQEVQVAELGNDAIGYFKPNTTAYNHWYGSAVALSADGRTFAVQSATNRGDAVDSMNVHVYRKASPTSAWRHEALLLPNVAQSYTIQPYWGGNPLALSGDGNLLAFGVPTEAEDDPNQFGGRGAVYLFRRNGTHWQLEQKLVGAQLPGDSFGTQVDLDDAGATLAITHKLDASGEFRRGTTEVYRRDAAGWQFVRTLPIPQDPNSQCYSVSLSGDGQTLFRTCTDSNYVGGLVQVFRAPSWEPDGEVPFAGATFVDSTYDGARFVVRHQNNFTRVFDWKAGTWIQDGEFTTGRENYLGANLAISRDGAIVAGGDYYDTLSDTGIVYPGTQHNGTVHSGAVFVYERRSFGWTLRRILKPALQRDQAFGTVLALGDRGRILAVGAFDDAGAASGIDGDPTDTSTPERGAAWLY